MSLPSWADHDLVTLRKRVFSIAPKVEVSTPDGKPVLFCQQKLMAFKGEIHVFSDETKSHEHLTITGRSVITTTPTFDVVDAETHEKVGVLQRRGIKSMFRDKWLVLDPLSDQPIGEINEEGPALLHRFINLIPQTYGFVLRGNRVGELKQHFNPFVYSATMDLRADTSKALDRRLALAAGVLLLLIEGRQQ